MTSHTQSDKTVEEILDKFADDCDYYGKGYVERNTTTTTLEKAIAALTARENRMVQEAVEKTRKDTLKEILRSYPKKNRTMNDLSKLTRADLDRLITQEES